jgi:hypothetical protein
MLGILPRRSVISMKSFIHRPMSDLGNNYEGLLDLLDVYEHIVLTDDVLDNMVLLKAEVFEELLKSAEQARIAEEKLKLKSKSKVAVTVELGERLLRDATLVLDEMGLDVETYMVMCLKAVVREGRIPFEVRADGAVRK